MLETAANVRQLRRPFQPAVAHDRRWKTRWPATLHRNGQALDALVLDISVWGAKIELRDGVAPAGELTLELDCIGPIPCAAIWSRGGLLGLRFAAAQDWLARLREAAGAEG